MPHLPMYFFILSIFNSLLELKGNMLELAEEVLGINALHTLNFCLKLISFVVSTLN